MDTKETIIGTGQCSDGRKMRKIHVDRIALKADALAKIDGWLSAVEDQFKGIRISRSELVNWLISSRSELLSKSELKNIREQFFDEVAFAAWALKQLRAAKAEGKNPKLSEIIAPPAVRSAIRPPRKGKLAKLVPEPLSDGPQSPS